MLAMQVPFTEWDIEDVQVLRTSTVYKLSGHAGEHLVIKTEINPNVQSSAMKHSKVAMKAVDRKAGNVKLLVESELQALEAWVDLMKRVTENFAENKVDNFSAGVGTKDLADALKFQRQNVWYKMPLADMTDAEKLLEARLGASKDKSVMRMFADGLKADGGLEQLGRIIAADMYIGNTDRFNPEGGIEKDYGGKLLKFKATQNVGNIFVIGKKTQQRISVSGHDFIDPSSPYKNFGNELEFDGPDKWIGEAVCKAATRKKFAKHIIDDLETILTPNRKAFSPFRKLPRDAAARLERGMLEGMRQIVDAVEKKYGKKTWPTGVKARYDQFKSAV